MADPTIHSGTGAYDAAGATSIASASLATTTGRFLVAVLHRFGGGTTTNSVSTAQDSLSIAGSSQNPGGDAWVETWYTPNPITGNASAVVTASFSASAAYRFIGAVEVSLAGASAMAYDAQATAAISAAASTTHTTNSVTTTGADALIVGGAYTWDSYREISNGTATVVWEDDHSGGSVDFGAIFYRLTDAAGGYTASVTTGTGTELIMTATAFTFTVSGSSIAPGSRISLLGVG